MEPPRQASSVPAVTYWINSYHPLASSPNGPWRNHPEIPPFADASCRREPDLEARFPAITGLCRVHAVKLLKRGDVVAYCAIKFKYDREPRHRRLTAVLRVEEECSSHAKAGDWYSARGEPFPRNLMLPGNGPLPLSMTEGFYWDEVEHNGKTRKKQVWPRGPEDEPSVLAKWDALYEKRRLRCQEVRPCSVIWSDIATGKRLSDDIARHVFPDGFPKTKDAPQEIARDELFELLPAIDLPEVCARI
jgi:hypothetical protein